MVKTFLLMVLSAWAIPCFAQTTEPPKPGPEQQATQDFFVGNWACEFSTVNGAVKQTCEMRLDRSLDALVSINAREDL